MSMAHVGDLRAVDSNADEGEAAEELRFRAWDNSRRSLRGESHATAGLHAAFHNVNYGSTWSSREFEPSRAPGQPRPQRNAHPLRYWRRQ